MHLQAGQCGNQIGSKFWVSTRFPLRHHRVKPGKSAVPAAYEQITVASSSDALSVVLVGSSATIGAITTYAYIFDGIIAK